MTNAGTTDEQAFEAAPKIGECEECGTYGVDLDYVGADGRSVCDDCRDEDAGPSEPPAHLADAWRRFQNGEEVSPPELRKLDEWRADAREDALGW